MYNTFTFTVNSTGTELNQNRYKTFRCFLMENPTGDISMMDGGELTWLNVLISFSFILFDIGISTLFRLGIGVSLLVAGVRCAGQLAFVATVLHQVFETKNPWLVALICCA